MFFEISTYILKPHFYKKSVIGKYLRNAITNFPLTSADKPQNASEPSTFIVCKFEINRPFYRYGGHIELIRFKEYYGMPRGALAQYLRAPFGEKENFTVYLWGKRPTLNSIRQTDVDT